MTTQKAAGRKAHKLALIDISAILLALMAAFLLRLPAATLDAVPAEYRAEYVAEDGLPYFSELDSYFYLRRAKELAQKEPFDPRWLVANKDDALRSAPTDKGFAKLGLSAIAATVYKALNGVFKLSIEQVAYWLGALLSLLAVIPVYAYVRRQTNALGGFVGAIAAAVCIPYISHTHPGFFDTDSLLGVLPLTYILSAARAMQAKAMPGRLLWSAVGALALGLVSLCWVTYSVYFMFIVIFTVLYALCVLLCPRRAFAASEQARPRILRFLRHGGVQAAALYVVFSVLSLMLFCGADELKRLMAPFLTLAAFTGGATAAYPSVGTFVAEIRKLPLLGGGIGGLINADYSGVINSVGGAAALAIAAICMLMFAFACMRRLQKSKQRAHDDLLSPFGSPRALSVNGVLFATWLLIGFAVAMIGARFAVFGAFPTAVLTGMAAGWLTSRLLKGNTGLCFRIGMWLLAALLAWAALYSTDHAAAYAVGGGVLAIGAGCLLLGRSRRFPAKALALCLALSMLLAPCLGAYKVTRNIVPDVSDTMADAMAWAQNSTEPNAVIVSWWDYGYYFEYAGERRALLDGGKNNAKLYCYLGRAFFTDDMKLSAAILNMLNASGTKAIDTLDALYGDAALTWEILNAILKLPPADARVALREQYGLAPDTAEHIVALSLPSDAPPLYLALSSDMQDKMQAISYYGSWEFGRGTFAQRLFARSSASVVIEPRDSKALPLYGLKSMTAMAGVDATGRVQAMLSDNSTVPATPVTIGELWVVQDGGIDKTIMSESPEAPVLLLFKEGNKYSAAVMDKALAGSVFTRLYLLGGAGQGAFVQAYEGSFTGAAGETAAQRKLGSLRFGSSPVPAYVALWRVLP